MGSRGAGSASVPPQRELALGPCRLLVDRRRAGLLFRCPRSAPLDFGIDAAPHTPLPWRPLRVRSAPCRPHRLRRSIRPSSVGPGPDPPSAARHPPYPPPCVGPAP